MVPFQSLGTVSNWPSIVTMAISLAISEIFSVKNDLTLKYGFGHSRSLKMAWFDKRRMTFCWSAIVTIALSCTTCQLFNVE